MKFTKKTLPIWNNAIDITYFRKYGSPSSHRPNQHNRLIPLPPAKPKTHKSALGPQS